MSVFPVVVTEAGAIPTPPQKLYADLISLVESKVPGYTANLPPGLITDLASTATGALVLCDQAMVDLINSVTPYGANIPLLMQLGGIYGVPKGAGSNTSVFVTFMGPPGFVVTRGFIVGDGNYQYVVQNNVIIPDNGQSVPVYCLANREGSWAVPAGSVTQTVTSVPESITLSCVNLTEGLPGLDAQGWDEYRAQVMQAGMLAVQGTPDTFRASVENVAGVQPRLVSYRQIAPGKWAAIVGGGNPYDVALAIYVSVPDISVLTADVNNPSGFVPHAERIAINDYPDTYEVSYIVPDSQGVRVILTWNTSSKNYVDPAAISRVSVPALVDYIESIYVGQPINIYQMQNVFVNAVSSTLSPEYISLIDIQVFIDGEVAAPEPHSGLIYGDLYKYFDTDASHVMVRHYE
ncbi:baseplate J/gp47 family protein [Enterobacter ludwigii]